MSSDTITLKVSERKEVGKAVKALRRQGIVPANMYERGKESQSLSAPAGEIAKVFNQAGKHHPVELVLDGKKHLAMIREVDIDPVKNTLRHVAFHAVKKNEKVEAEIPVKIDGEVPAEKISLLVLQNLDTVMVEALPSELPNELFVPGDKLAEEGDKVTVADIKLPEGVTMLTDPEIMVADVQTPKDQIAAADAALEEAKEADETEATPSADDAKEEAESEAGEEE